MSCMQRLFVAGLALILAGCNGLAVQAPEKHRFVLEDQARPNCSASPAATSLLIDPLLPAAYLDSLAVAYSRALGTRDAYQYALWTERPATQVALLTRDRLRAACLVRDVALSGDGLRGELLLTLRLRDFYHDAATAPGEARLVLEAQLIERRAGRLLAHTTLNAAASATGYHAAGAAAGFNAATSQALDQLVAWLAAQPALGAR